MSFAKLITEVEEPNWDDMYCKICFDPYDKSHFNCGHIVHLDCQVKSASYLCPECQQPIRVTRWMESLIMQWKLYWVAKKEE